MKKNGDAIYATTSNPFGPVTWGRITAKPGHLYLHVFDWPSDGKLVVPAGNAEGKVSARFLAERDQAQLDVRKSDSDLVITLAGQAPDPIATVIQLDGEF